MVCAVRSDSERATRDGGDRTARWEMMMAAMEGAMAFQKGLGAVHAMSHPLGAVPGLPLHHGTLNALLLPPVLRFNAPAITAKARTLNDALGIAPDSDPAAFIEGLDRGSWNCRPICAQWGWNEPCSAASPTPPCSITATPPTHARPLATTTYECSSAY